MERSKLVLEWIVRNLNDRFQFWVDILGFCVAYARPHEKLVYLSLGSAQLMLEELGVTTGQWLTASLEQPFGRGINFQIEVDTVAPILERLHCAGYALFRDCQDCWYVAGAVEVGQRECIVQDPGGYLVRLVERLGERAIA